MDNKRDMELSQYIFPIYSGGTIVGQGFVADGYFVTAAHVVKDFPECFVVLNGKRFDLAKEGTAFIGDGDIDHDPLMIDAAAYPFDSIDSPLHLSDFVPQKGDVLENYCVHEVMDVSSLNPHFNLTMEPAVSTGDDEDNYFFCHCKRYGGSSGSPLLKGNEVVGVMHGGDDNELCTFLKSTIIKNAKKFSRKQLEVIKIKNGYNMVLAGPGCGKTDILAERIARAYEQDGIDLSDMLCLTFTNRAARGMFDRIHSRLGNDAVDLFVGNIHRYCSHFLFEESASGVTGETSVMDEDDANEVLTSIISDMEIKDMIGYEESNVEIGHEVFVTLVSLDWDVINQFFGLNYQPTGRTGMIKPSKADKIVSEVRKKILDIQHMMYQIQKEHPREDYYRREFLEKNLIAHGFGLESIFEESALSMCSNQHIDDIPYYAEKALSLAYKYQVYKERNGLLDFDDLLLFAYDAYYNDDKREYKRYKWIQIDEIQDLSHFQLSLVDLLTEETDDFVVLYLGDEQQAIYSFMGASLNSLNYLKARCGNNIFRLDKNFRSPKYLLDIYNEFAIKELKVDKDFLPEPKDNAEAGFYDVCLHEYADKDEETERVYESILPYLRDEKRKDERTALLVPWNIDANEISDRLKKDKISHFKISGLDSFQTVHMKTLMAHLNAVSNDFNMMAWSRILKQTYAVDSYKEGRDVVKRMREIGMCPSDLLRDSGTYLSEFVTLFDKEEIVLFDTETTGTDVFNDDIVQIAAYKIRGGEIVSGSFFNIIMYTNKKIPKKLGKEVNPLIKIYDETPNKYSREEGLALFLEYVGDRILMGHNVNYDYNILRYNLQRDCGMHLDDYQAKIIDTLQLAHLVKPRQRKYKLGWLIEQFGLIPPEQQGLNYHQADEDIKGTLELAKFCRREANKHLAKQSSFLQEKKTREIIDEWKEQGYKDCYMHAKQRLFVLSPDDEDQYAITGETTYAITEEMKYASQELQYICEFRLVDSFDSIIEFLNADVISRPKPEPNALYSQFSNHLMDLSTYREADLCSSSTFKEKLFVSTVHKAKGLEFENVLMLRCNDGRYPHFAHDTEEQKEEDKRLFYVGISRAMKRLVVSGYQRTSYNDITTITPFIKPIIHHFTLRTEISNSNGVRVVVEIGHELLRVNRIVQISEQKSIQRKDYNISRVYDNGAIKNQFDVKRLLSSRFTRADVFGSIDSTLRTIGGFPISNN